MKSSPTDAVQPYSRGSLIALFANLLSFLVLATFVLGARGKCLSLFEEAAVQLPFLTRALIRITPALLVIAGVVLLIALLVKEFRVPSRGVNLTVNVAAVGLQLGFSILYMIAMYAGEIVIIRAF